MGHYFFFKMWSHNCSCVHTNWETRVECKYNILKAFYIYKFRRRYKNCCSGDPWASCLFRGFFGEGGGGDGGGLITLLLEEDSYFHFKIKHWDVLKQKHFPSFFFLKRNSNALFSCFSLGNIIFWPWQIDKLMLFCCSRLGFNHKGFQNG